MAGQKHFFKVGDKVGNFTVVSAVTRVLPRSDASKRQSVDYTFQCICGSKLRVPAWIAKNRKSCGCLTRDLISAAVTKSNTTQSGYTIKHASEYACYSAMIRRCYKPRDVGYAGWGGRGIRVCKRWTRGTRTMTGFQAFIKDLGTRPSLAHSLDREDPDGHYTPKNTRWSNKSVQIKNTRKGLFQNFEDKSVLKTYCKRYKLPYGEIVRFLSRGGSVHDVDNWRGSFIGMDPGTKNFALCWVKNNQVQASHLLLNPIYEINTKTFDSVSRAFHTEFTEIVRKTKPTQMAVERFMVRGFSANIIEMVGFMIGGIIGIARRHNLGLPQLLTSAQWKIALKRVGNIESLYADAKLLGIPNHVVDAMCMARYLMSGKSFFESDFVWLKTNLPRCVNKLDGTQWEPPKRKPRTR